MISGSLVQRYWVDVSGAPGNASPAAHRATDSHTDDSGTVREGGSTQAPAGGNYVAEDVLSGNVPVLAGTAGSPNTNHVADNTHKGVRGGGMAQPPDFLDWSQESTRGGHTPATLSTAGMGGAEFGGLVRTGTMDPSSNPGGMLLGHRYITVADRRRQNLHFNKPGLRAVRWPVRTAERNSPMPAIAGAVRTSMFNPVDRYSQGGGPSLPKLRRLLRPAGQQAAQFDVQDQAPALTRVTDAGPVGGEWVR